MKNTSAYFRFRSLALLAGAVFLSFFGCGPGANTPGTNNGNTSQNSNANATSPPSPTPSPTTTPPCDDKEIDQKLIAAFTAPGNQGGPNGFGKIQKTMNFYARGCEIYLWGYTKNFGTFKRVVQVFGASAKTARSVGLNIDNLVIDQSEYVPGGIPCGVGYKACNDICIPEGDTCWNGMSLSKPPPGAGNQNTP